MDGGGAREAYGRREGDAAEIGRVVWVGRPETFDPTVGRIGETVAGQDDRVAIGIAIARREDDTGP